MGKHLDNPLASLEEIKTSIMGYDKEDVLEYIRTILKRDNEERQKETKQYLAQIKQLESDKEILEGQLKIYKYNYENLSRHLEKMTAAWEKNARYAAKRDSQIQDYQQREESITEQMKKADVAAKAIMDQAKRLRGRMLDDAEQQKDQMLENTRQECMQMLKTESDRVSHYRQELERMANAILPILQEQGKDLQRLMADQDQPRR